MDRAKGRCEEGAVSPEQSRQLWAPGGTTFVDLATVLRGIAEFCSQARVPGRGDGTDEQQAELQATQNKKTGGGRGGVGVG